METILGGDEGDIGVFIKFINWWSSFKDLGITFLKIKYYNATLFIEIMNLEMIIIWEFKRIKRK